MLLDFGHQQNLAPLLFRNLKGIGARNALTLRMNDQGQSQSVKRRYVKYPLQDEFEKIHGRVIVAINDEIPHTRTFYLYPFEKIASRFPTWFKAAWVLLLKTGPVRCVHHLDTSRSITQKFKASISANGSPLQAAHSRTVAWRRFEKSYRFV